MSDFDSTTASIQDLKWGLARDVLAQADVVIAVDAATDSEEVVYGRDEWQRAVDIGNERDLEVVRVELDLESDDPDWLLDAIDAIIRGQADESEDEYEPGGEGLED